MLTGGSCVIARVDVRSDRQKCCSGICDGSIPARSLALREGFSRWLAYSSPCSTACSTGRTSVCDQCGADDDRTLSLIIEECEYGLVYALRPDSLLGLTCADGTSAAAAVVAVSAMSVSRDPTAVCRVVTPGIGDRCRARIETAHGDGGNGAGRLRRPQRGHEPTMIAADHDTWSDHDDGFGETARARWPRA
jgi:hypothetical protein